MKSARENPRNGRSGSRELSLHDPPEPGPGSEVFLLLHGLNLAPARMGAWRDYFLGEGFAVASIALAGHRAGDSRLWRRVSAADWLADVDGARDAVQERWPGAAVSVFGYSLGAVLAAVWSEERGIPWRRAVYLAPAFGVKGFGAPLLRMGRTLLPKSLLLPSFAPRAYRFRWATSMAAFGALLDLIDRLPRPEDTPEARTGGGSGPDGPPAAMEGAPQLIFHVEGDQLVSTQALLQYRRRFGAGLSFHPVYLPGWRRYPRHLAIDPESAGDGPWREMTGRVSRWLKGEGAAGSGVGGADATGDGGP